MKVSSRKGVEGKAVSEGKGDSQNTAVVCGTSDVNKLP